MSGVTVLLEPLPYRNSFDNWSWELAKKATGLCNTLRLLLCVFVCLCVFVVVLFCFFNKMFLNYICILVSSLSVGNINF